MSNVSKLIAIITLFTSSVANADLYTGHIASLEWKTHSSDAVLLVSVDTQSANAAAVTLVNVSCRPGDVFTTAESVAQSWKLPKLYGLQKDWRPDGEWLLFVRTWDESEPTIDHVVYLANPLQASWMSAVNTDGQLLVEKQAILAVVTDRLVNGGKMTSRQRHARRLVDQGSHRLGDVSVEDGHLKRVAPWLGGFQIPADIHTWEGGSESLLVQRITVPADESYREALLAYWTTYLQESHESRNRFRIGYPIFSLINYPDQRTEQLLIRLKSVDQCMADAETALEYLQFYESEFDLNDRKLLGSWVLTMRTQRFQLDLMDDHQLIAHRQPIPFPNPDKHQREWFAKGRWNRHYGRLHMFATRFNASDNFVRRRASLPSLDHLPIVQIANDAITLDKGVVLKRAQKPIEIPNSLSR
jgi:hypothetical protein